MTDDLYSRKRPDDAATSAVTADLHADLERAVIAWVVPRLWAIDGMDDEAEWQT